MDDSPWMPPGTDATGADPGEKAASPTPPVTVPPPAPAGVAPGLPTPTLPPAAPPPPPVVAAAPPPPPPPVPTLPTPQQVAPAPAAPAPAAFGAPTADPVAAPPFDVTQAAATTRRSGRSKVLVGTGIVGVLAVGAAGVFAVQSFGDEAQGGAATPDELGTSLMTALENEDALGMIDVLLPGERDLLRQPAIDYVAELTRLEVLSSDADLAAIAGLDVVLENEDIAVEGTNVDDIVNIRMSADAEVTVDGAAFPIGDLVTDNMDQEMVDEMRSSTQTERELLDFRMAAVEQDGRWYFSLFHTAAEDVRDDEEPARDIPLEGVGARGADSPEAAVDQLLDSVEALDLELMIQTMNPGEAAALQRYAPMFLADAQAEIDDAPLEWEITTREFRVEGDGSQRTVFIDAIAIEGTADGEPFSVSVDGSCVRAEAAGETFDQCVSDATASEELDQLLDEAPQLREFLTALEEAFADMEPVGLELREYEGAWYVSPISTLNEAVLAFLRALDRAEIDRLIELGQGAFDETLGGFGGLGDMGLGSGDDPFVIDPGLDDDPVADTGDGGFGETGFDTATDMAVATTLPMDDGMTVTGTAPDTYVAPDWEACYSELDVAAAVACFDQYVQSGEIDEYMVPIELRFPECGLESRWNRELYSMPDAEFIATIEAAAPCYQALVDAGTISEFEMPSEVLNLECYEGRNWYNTFDDPEYDDRYWACVDALYAQDTVIDDTGTG